MSTENNMDAASAIALAEIKGDVKRIFDRFDTYARDAERRDKEHADYKTNTDKRLNNHGERIADLEKDRSERAGMTKAAKWGYAVVGGSAGTIVATVAALVARGMHL